MEKIKFNEGWKVWKDLDPFELVFRVPDDAAEVDLPHDAMFHEEQKQGAENGGYTGNYRNACVFVNQSKVGESAYGYTDFAVDIGDYVKYGEQNDVLVAVKCGTKNSRWYSGAGIYKDAWIIYGNSLR